MRHVVPWMLVLLGLPWAVLADGNAQGGVAPADDAGIEGAPAVAPPLDLRLDPAQLPAPASRPGPSGIESLSGGRQAGVAPPAAESGLSFGVEVKPRRAADNRALASQPDAPGLQDDLERLIEHSTLGLRGTYRF